MASLDWRVERINRNRRLSSKRPIPGGITIDDFRTIQTYLADMFQDIETETGRTGLPRELHMRLNDRRSSYPAILPQCAAARPEPGARVQQFGAEGVTYRNAYARSRALTRHTVPFVGRCKGVTVSGCQTPSYRTVTTLHSGSCPTFTPPQARQRGLPLYPERRHEVPAQYLS